jgi:hypothetical protein
LGACAQHSNAPVISKISINIRKLVFIAVII